MFQLESLLAKPLSHRARQASDSSFIEELFISCKHLELAAVIPPAMLDTMLKQQYIAQSSGYAEQFPNAHDFIVLSSSIPIGRFMLDVTDKELRLVDIAIMPMSQNIGHGRTVMQMLIDNVKTKQIDITLSVSPSNQIAFALYSSLGFTLVSNDLANIEMRLFSKHV